MSPTDHAQLWPRIKEFVEWCEARGVPALVSVAVDQTVLPPAPATSSAPGVSQAELVRPDSGQLVGATAACLIECMPSEMRTALVQLVGPEGIELESGQAVDTSTGLLVGEKAS